MAIEKQIGVARLNCPSCGGSNSDLEIAANRCGYCNSNLYETRVVLPTTLRVLEVELNEVLADYKCSLNNMAYFKIIVDSVVREALQADLGEKGRGKPYLQAGMKAIRRALELMEGVKLASVDVAWLLDQIKTVTLADADEDEMETFMTGYTNGVALVSRAWDFSQGDVSYFVNLLVDLRKALAGAKKMH